MNPLENPVELGHLIGAARAYANWDIDELAERLEVEADQVRRWEAGLGTGDWIDVRRRLAERIAEVTGAPRTLLGLHNEDDLTRRIIALETEMADLRERCDRHDTHQRLRGTT